MLTQFGKLLRIIRINSGDSAKDMAKKLNLSPSYLSAIENGNRRIPSDMEQLLCEAYPLSDVDKEKIRFAILETHEILKIDITSFSPEKKALLYSFVKDDISDEKISQILSIIKEK